jgi:hypothetical protein
MPDAEVVCFVSRIHSNRVVSGEAESAVLNIEELFEQAGASADIAAALRLAAREELRYEEQGAEGAHDLAFVGMSPLFSRPRKPHSAPRGGIEPSSMDEIALPAEDRYRLFVASAREEGVMFSCWPRYRAHGQETLALWSDPETLIACNQEADRVFPLYTQRQAEQLRARGQKTVGVVSIWEALEKEPLPIVVFPTESDQGKEVAAEDLRRDLGSQA